MKLEVEVTPKAAKEWWGNHHHLFWALVGLVPLAGMFNHLYHTYPESQLPIKLGVVIALVLWSGLHLVAHHES